MVLTISGRNGASEVTTLMARCKSVYTYVNINKYNRFPHIPHRQARYNLRTKGEGHGGEVNPPTEKA